MAFFIPENRKGKGLVYLHNFYLNPMFDPSGPRPGADAHNCTVGYVSEYKPPSLYPGVNLTTINDGDGFAQIPHPGLPRETPLVLAANTYADEGGQTPVRQLAGMLGLRQERHVASARQHERRHECGVHDTRRA